MGAAQHRGTVAGCWLFVARRHGRPLPNAAVSAAQQPTTNNQQHLGKRQRIRSITCLLVLSMLCPSLLAQTVGKLRLMIDPGAGFEFVLDHKYRMQQREVELGTGPHHFTFWAPERSMVDTTLIVLENQTREALVRLPFSPEYRAYQEELRQEKKKLWLEVALPTAATLGAGILTYSTFKQYRDAHDQLSEDEDAYRLGADPRQLADLKSEVIPRHKSEFTDKRGLFFASVGILTAVAAGSAYMIIRHAKKPAPQFHDREKVKFDGLVWAPSGNDGGMWLAGLHLDLR
jgi:hypothetical protein